MTRDAATVYMETHFAQCYTEPRCVQTAKLFATSTVRKEGCCGMLSHTLRTAPSVRVCKASLGDDKLIIRSSESARDAEMYTERSRTALAHFNTSFCWRKRPK